MLTFLSSPKPFKGKDKENQYRAINTWLLAAENVEVILYGNSEGIDEAGFDLNVKVVKKIRSSPSGVPYFGAIADHAAEFGTYDIQVYINCDILIHGLYEASRSITFKNFLLIGQRIDLFENIIVTDKPANFKLVVQNLFRMHQLAIHEKTGIDYFVFSRNMWQGLKPISIGRGGYDNALLAFCKLYQYPIIDGTLSVIALHQFHDYKHVNGDEQVVFYGSEAKQNISVAGKYSLLTVSDADYILDNYQLIHSPCRGDYLREIELKWRYIRKWEIMSLLLRGMWRIFDFFKLVKNKEYNLETLIKTRHPIFATDNSDENKTVKFIKK